MKNSKKYIKIISIVILTILISFIGYKVYSASTYGISTYMAIYGNWVENAHIGQYSGVNVDKYNAANNSYLTGTNKSDHLNKTVGFPLHTNTSDYGYVAWYPQVWCLSEGKINSTDTNSLRVYGIIEIGKSNAPSYTTIYYLDKNKNKQTTKGVAGTSEERRAQAAFTMLVGKDYEKDNVTGVAQRNFINTYWSFMKGKTYLAKFKYTAQGEDYTSNTAVRNGITYTYETYADNIVDLNPMIDTDNYGKLTCKPVDKTSNSLDIKTAILNGEESDTKVFNMSSNSKLVTGRVLKLTKQDGGTVQYNIKKDGSIWYLYSGSTKKGYINVTDGHIYLTTEMSVSKVEMTLSYDYIHAVLYMIGGHDTQTRGVSKGEWLEGSHTSSKTISTIVNPEVNVSMQKYIKSVNGVEVSPKRANMKTFSGETNTGHKTSDGVYKQAAKGDSYKVIDTYKYNTPVPIIEGDEVSYRISIYNNDSANEVTGLRLEDRLPSVYVDTGRKDSEGKNIYNIDTVAELVSVKVASGGSDAYLSNGDELEVTTKKEPKTATSTKVYKGSFERIVCKIDKLKKGGKLYLEVKLRFNTDTTGDTVANTAFLYSDGAKNKREYRTVDRDYVKMEAGYKVSLEKFVSKLNGTNINDRAAASESEAKSKYRFNETIQASGESGVNTYTNYYSFDLNSAKKQTDNLHFTKYNSPVEVKDNDKVTFTIRIRNTGTKPIRVTRIYDAFKFDESDNLNYKGTKLVYDASEGIRGNGGGEVADDHYGTTDDNNKSKNLDIYLIQFENPTLIAAGGHVDVTISYTVKVSTTSTRDSLRYINKAKIVSIENQNEVGVTDGDGDANNADTDFLATQKYSVSLEKFVSKVGSNNITGREDKRYNEDVKYAGENTPNKNRYKIENKVPTKIGDDVIFTIRLKNTGTAPVKITKIYDTHRYDDDNASKTLTYGLEYDSSYGIKAKKSDGTTVNKYGKITDYEYMMDTDTNSEKETLRRYLIEFEDAELLDPGKHVDVYIKFKVCATDAKLENSEQVSFFNKAVIVELKNSIGSVIDIEEDSDGTDNNADMDWVLRTKLYQARLEKYVARVNDSTDITPGDEREHHPIYEQGDFSKENNPVKVGEKDVINYTIKIVNTGTDKKDYGTIKQVVIADAIPEGLECLGCTSSNSDKVTINEEKNTFTYEGSIKVDDHIKFTVQYKVKDDLVQGTKIKNTANISEIYKKVDDDFYKVDDNDGTTNNKDSDWVKLKVTAVAIQKNITKVESPNGDIIEPNDRHDHRYNSYSKDPNHKQSFKPDNRILVEPGDIVTFTLRLQNTGEADVKISQIYDAYSWNTTEALNGTGLEYVQNSIEGNGSSYKITPGYMDKNDEHTDYDKFLIEFENPETIAVGGEKIVTIKFKVKSTISTEKSIWNKVGIEQLIDYTGKTRNLDFMKEELKKDADGPDNNYDTDFMLIQAYKVSLEKFITSVTDAYGRNEVKYTNRTGKNETEATNTYRFNEDPYGDDGSSVLDSNTGELKSGSKESDNLHFYKHTNAVRAEVGDKVTFTIRLRNTGTTKVKVKEIYDSFKFNESDNSNYNGVKLVYDSTAGIKGNGGGKITNYHYGNDNGNENKKVDKYLIKFDNPALIEPGKHVDVTITFSIEIENKKLTKQEMVLHNKAVIVSIQNKNNVDVLDGDGDVNNKDMDFIRTKIYKVSLQKIIYSVDGNTNFDTEYGKDTSSGVLSRWKSWESDANKNGVNGETSSDRGLLFAKHNNPAIASSGNGITYAIKVRNDGNTNVTIGEIEDKILGDQETTFSNIFNFDSNGTGFSLLAEDSNGTRYLCNQSHNHKTAKCCWLEYKNPARKDDGLVLKTNIELKPAEELTIYLTTTSIKLSNMSTEIIRNEAKISEESLYNRNNKPVYDKTGSNNNDADYFQMKDIIISGRVWNDIPSDKTQENYDGLYKDGDKNLQGITVRLYREGVTSPIATKTTDANGAYTFASSDISDKVVTDKCQRRIKGPYKCRSSEAGNSTVEHGANYWAGTYYSYYVVFEYDGIRYTSTTITDRNNALGVYNSVYNDSNAKEDNTNAKVENLTSRSDFNARFATINNESGINYATKNEDNYIPQSLHQYNPETMTMKSATNKIELSNNDAREKQLQNINLGLRGKDIFDLELISNVDTIKITVNGQKGEYKYTNRVDLRQEDLKSNTKIVEDMANILNEGSGNYISSQEQKIREKDFNPISSYDSNQGVSEIEVTYKLTVHNTSPTAGTATKVINYYDSKYTFVKAYVGSTNLTAIAGPSGSNYKSAIITTTNKKLQQADTMDIYVVYKLNTPIKTTLSELTLTNPVPTYNMAEVYEYRTECGVNQTEYTRGLLDKDSAPGSANKEKVRLNTRDSSNLTTVGYYFAAKDLDKLKYEDDTYATPTLYFVLSTQGRKMTGTVFEDKTKLNSLKIKTGNGIKDADEVGVYGVTVQLVEQKEGGKVRAEVETDKNGYFEFENFLPGNYIIRYSYGDNERAVIQNKAQTGINGKSYNGEDFQATNNFKDVAELETNKLNTTANFWYIYNENKGISTAKDNSTRRAEVSNYVTNFIDEQMTVLNNMRDGKNASESAVIYYEGGVDKTITVDNIIEKTKMYADTENILITVEKTEKVEGGLAQNKEFKKYEIKNMNFGIAEVPVTTIDLQKHIDSFRITDASGKNVIASMKKVDEAWQMEGDVINVDSVIDISIEDEQLQGARLEITFAITSNIKTEFNFDGSKNISATMKGLVDFVNNNLAYNPNLGDNAKYWEVTNHQDVKASFEALIDEHGGVTKPQGTVDPNGTIYTTVVKATASNPLLNTKENATATITLEKILSSTDATLEEIITSTVDISEYNNIVEITGFNYSEVVPDSGGTPDPGPTPSTSVMRDRIRNKNRYIVIPGVQYDNASSEVITIHPPTGDSGIATIYYIIAVVALAIFAIGVYGVKKFVIKK